ncbi:MAG: alanine dehydrogenase [Bacteroidota bacterium]
MVPDSSKSSYTSMFGGTELLTQPERLGTLRKQGKLIIGVPKESSLQETRVALVPNSVRSLIGEGHKIIVQRGAGIKSNYSDRDYSEAGAVLVDSNEEVFKTDVLIKIAPPSLDEIDLLHPGQILISPMQIPLITEEYVQRLRQKRVTAVALEYLKAEDGSFPIVRVMSEIAGKSAMLTAAELLSDQEHGRGALLGGISGVPPAKVVILGAGVVAEYAVRTALGLGASIRVFDNNIYKIMRLQNQIGRQLHSSAINPVYLKYQLLSADVVIGAIHSKTGRTPMVVTEEMIAQMKNGSVIIDISIDQGGCFETSRVTSHENPTFVKHGVIHYCVPNIASRVPRTASVAFSNIITPILLKAGSTGSVENLLFVHHGIRHGVYTYKGCLTNEYLSKRFGIKYTDLNLLMASNL